jgi:hypothetical protein
MEMPTRIVPYQKLIQFGGMYTLQITVHTYFFFIQLLHLSCFQIFLSALCSQKPLEWREELLKERLHKLYLSYGLTLLW